MKKQPARETERGRETGRGREASSGEAGGAGGSRGGDDGGDSGPVLGCPTRFFRACGAATGRELATQRWACGVVAKQDAAAVVNQVSRMFRYRHPHLKRVRCVGDRLEILLCPAEDYPANQPALASLSNGPPTWSVVEKEIPVGVPAVAELRVQAQALWPCTFRPLVADAPPRELAARVVALLERVCLPQSASRECADSAAILGKKACCTVFISETPSRAAAPFDHAVLQLVDQTSQVTDGYLCTERTLLLSNEPCLMCGMALVHARVGTVFISGGRSTDSPLLAGRLHTQQSLNHRFKVYQCRPRGGVAHPGEDAKGN